MKGLIYFSDQSENEYCSIANGLDAIYLGVDFKINYLLAIRALCPDVDIYTLDYVDVRLTDRWLEG